MGCNCKKKIELEEKYGEEQEETLMGKWVRLLSKVIFFVLLIVMTIIVAPIMIIVVIYKVTLSKNKTFVLPKFLGKYLK